MKKETNKTIYILIIIAIVIFIYVNLIKDKSPDFKECDNMSMTHRDVPSVYDLKYQRCVVIVGGAVYPVMKHRVLGGLYVELTDIRR